MEKEIFLGFINKLRENLKAHKPLIQVLLGPRQVGKTTTILKLIEQSYKESSIYISADSVFNPDNNWLREQWLYAQNNQKILFIDEIQRVHNWSEAIKGLFDQSVRSKKYLRCVLLGSSSLEIQKGLSESLTGRFQLLRAFQWNFQESKEAYDLTFDEFLSYGGYPGSYRFIHSSDWFDYVKNSIIGTVVEKDILQFQNVRNPALFRQAFDILISYPAQEISYTKLLGQLQDKGNVELVKYYLSLYEGAFLIKTLNKFSNKVHLQRASSPKILPLAPCLPFLQIRDALSSEEEGRSFELIVGAQLVRTGEDLYYWREGIHEVDFVVKKGRKIWAIEVKNGRKKSRKGLDIFQKHFPAARLVIVDRENYFRFEKDPIKFLEEESI